MRPLAALITVAGLSLPGPRSLAADLWGGSVALTSDYFVRGITRTNDQAALQLDAHYLDSSGFVAGLFASNAQIDPEAPRDAELNPYLGFVWKSAANWHGKILASYYAYPWNQDGSQYNYVEFDADVGYRDWLEIAVSYSPDSPRYLLHRGLGGVSEAAVEMNLQQPLFRMLSGTGGLGYAELSGPGGRGYLYWSAGAALDLAPVSLAIAYVDTSSAARTFYHDAAATGRWMATAIWRF